MIIDYVWHHGGPSFVPPHLREVPVELSAADLSSLTSTYDVMLHRDAEDKLVLALDARRGRFRQR